jgi:hypothetical protein
MLILSLLLHSAHHHPSVPTYSLPAGSRFGEAFLISPGAPFITETPSMLQDPLKDIIDPKMGREWWSIIVSTSEKGIEMPNPWIYFASASEEWWKGLPIGKMTIVLGDDEVLRDDITKFAGNLKVCIVSPLRDLRYWLLIEDRNITTRKSASTNSSTNAMINACST